MPTQLNPNQTYAYAEILEILSFLDISEVNKIPQKILKVFNAFASKDYTNHLNPDIPLEEQDISKETTDLLALLTLNYWCESEDEKTELKNLLKDNEKLKNEELYNKYNPDNIFKKSENIAVISNDNNIAEEINLPLDISTLTWYNKFKITLINFIKKIFKK